MSFATSSSASFSSPLGDGADTTLLTTTPNAASDLVYNPYVAPASLGASAEAARQPPFADALPLPLRGVSAASASGERRRSQDFARRPLTAAAAVVAVPQSARSVLSSTSHSLASANPPLPPLLRPAEKTLKMGDRSCAANGVAGGASLFRNWSTSAALLDEVLDTPFFHLLPKSTESTAGTVLSSAAAVVTAGAASDGHSGVPSLDSSPLKVTFASSSTLGSAATAASASVLARKSSNRAGLLTTGVQRQTEPTMATATAAAAHGPVLPSVTLPTSDATLPSILLIALADMEALQQSFCAHARATPVKDHLAEFKRLVATSMRSELAHGHEGPPMEGLAAEAHPDAAAAGGVNADHDAVAGKGAKATSDVVQGDDSALDSTPIASSMQTHDAAVRAALRAAHGFLYGNETVPIGVPTVHLQRARREWVARYSVLHVQPRLQRTQRRRYETWEQRHPQPQGFTGRGTAGGAGQHGAPDSQSTMTAMSLCAALQPTYWRAIAMGRPGTVSATPITPATARPATAGTLPTEVGGATGSHAFILPPTGQPWSSSTAYSASLLHSPSPVKPAAVPMLYTAVWDADLYDDLCLAVSVEQCDMMDRQATSRTTVEAMELDGPVPKGFSEAVGYTSSASLMELSAPPLLLGHAGDLTQLQLTLPIFVYVVSRYLFVAHYAAYFPTGLFSRALIDPFYFSDAAQCSPEYALRMAPTLRREAQRVYADYAAQLADAHRCFPDRTHSIEVPLSPKDMFHLWELLCPPQQQDIAGRWNPVPWGSLTPEEEEVLLEEEFKSTPDTDQRASDKGASGGESLLSYPYARAARQAYRWRLQQLAQHPSLLSEVHRLLSHCEDVALGFFTVFDVEQKGCITWEAFTNALIEEADVQNHQRKVRERAVHLTRTSASIFDRYVVEPLAPALARLGYTGNVFEVRHSVSLVMLEGPTDYAVCDGARLGSINQRFLVRPMEVLRKDLEGEPHDAFGRLIRGLGGDEGASGRQDAPSTADAGGYDAALQQRPWRFNQRPQQVYIRYEDGRQLPESTALNVLQQLSPSSTTGSGTAACEGDGDDKEDKFTSVRAHQPAKLVSLEGVLAVEDVSPCVPWPVYVARGSDMLLRLYGTSRAVQALPEAGVLRCTETVSSMEWAAGGRGERHSSMSHTGTSSGSAAARSAGVDGDGNGERMNRGCRSGSAALGGGRTPPLAGGLTSRQKQAPRDRFFVQRQEYLLLGTRKGTILIVDLYALLNRIPRLATLAGSHSGGTVGGGSGSAAGNSADGVGGNGGVASTMGAISSVVPAISERIGSSESAWTGYRAIAHRTFYSDIGTFVVHTRQLHTPGTLVSSIVAVASNGLVVSSGLDGDVFTMRLTYSSAPSTTTRTLRTPRGGAAGVGTTITDTDRPLVRIEVLHRMHVCDTGVRCALPIPFRSLLAVQTAASKVYLYHSSVLPTAPALVNGGRGNASSIQMPSAAFSAPRVAPEGAAITTGSGVATVSAASSATPPRLELYDAAAPHLGSIVTMMVVRELDQLITMDSNAYVKVWSLRQTQPLTSFYAWAPLSILKSSNGAGDAGRLAGWASTQGSTAAHHGGVSGAGTSAYGALTASPALLRTTKNSIEAAVEAAVYRLQPCRSAAYNYAGRQLFVMGSHNAAYCFFVSGQSISRAHTEPLRALLVDTSMVSRVGGVQRRLISLSSADCRVWSLPTGAMELGIRANSAEYRHLVDHRTTGNTQGKLLSTAKSREQRRLEGRGGRGGRCSGARPRPRYPAQIYIARNSAILEAASSSATTTGEPHRLLLPSVDDVMRAVSTRPWSSHRRSYHRPTKWRMAVTAVGLCKETAVAAATTPSQMLTVVKQPHGNAMAFSSSSSAGGGAADRGDGAEDEADGLAASALRHQNLLLSDIRCACLGPGGEWIGYALLHGDIRVHRSDSGRLLHTFITTPPSMEDLVEAAMQYQHLFTSIAAAYALPPLPSSLHGANIGDAATATSSMPTGVSATRGGGGGSASDLPTTVAPPAQSPTARLTLTTYAKAVALVLEQLLASTIGVTCGSAGPAPASAMLGDGDNRLGRNVHQEPLHLLYLDASQELFVTYADGLLRSFTLLGHSNTATRVIVSRTLINRALMQVQRALASHRRQTNTVCPSTTACTGVPRGGSTALAASLSAAPLQRLLITRALSCVDLSDAGVSRGQCSSVAVGGNSNSLSKVTSSEGAGGGATGRLTNADAAEVMPAAPPSNAVRAMMASLSTHQIEPDVVLLATASPPLGLVCLVHASGLVTVLDIQSRSEKGGVVRMRVALDNAGDVNGEGCGGCAEQQSGSGRERARAGVVVHSFTTADEVTAATFLGAYPCLVLADRQHQLSFHLMKGSSLLALLGEFAEKLEEDGMACAAGLRERSKGEASRSATARRPLMDVRNTTGYGAAASSPRLPPPSGHVERDVERGHNSTAASSTLVWTFSVDETCASQRALGYVTALAFDALYATVYVGTSQGYVLSYLVRRFLMAFQLTPVFLRGVDGVAALTYAAELQRSFMTARSGGSLCNTISSSFLQNYLRVIFDVPAAVAAQVKEDRLCSPQRRYVGLNGNPSSAATTPNQSPKDLGGLVGVYKSRRDLFQTSWRDVTDKRRSGGSNYTCAAAPSQAIPIYTSGEALIAAAVLHDAVTRMMTVVSVCATTSPGTSSGTSATPDETQPWWCTPAGRTVQEYVTRKCGGDATRSDVGEYSGAANASPADSGELELDAEGVQLLRGWVAAVLTEQRCHLQHHVSNAEAVPEARRQRPRQSPFSSDLSAAQGGVSRTSSKISLSSSGCTAVPSMSTPADGRDVSARDERGADPDQGTGAAEAVEGGAATAQELAEALVQEVQEELLFGEEAPATMSAAHVSAVAGSALTTPGTPPPHPITDAWIECLFTRHVMCTTSRTPLCFLTPPAMLERARRERQDRRGRVAAAAALGNAVGSALSIPEWDAYVEGALPDYLADILTHPSQVLTEVERQALQQRSIMTLQCRRNGYLCIGHADGSVTLWTPYACARLESLCPRSSLAATLDRLAASVKAQLHHLHERILQERQRLAFEGNLHNARHTEEEGAARVKHRIRAMLLEHHLAQLQLEMTEKEGEEERRMNMLAKRGQDTEPHPVLSTPGRSTFRLHNLTAPHAQRHTGRAEAAATVQEAKRSGTSSQPFMCGSMEAELLSMRPLLCMLLGISSPAELRARQLSLEDLFFLPFQTRSLASLEAFNPRCYDVAVAVAMRRLRRELIEEVEESAAGEPAGVSQTLPDALTAAVTQAASTISPAVTSPAFHVSLSGSPRGVSGLVALRRGSSSPLHRRPLESVYDYRLSSLVKAWRDGADQSQSGRPSGMSGAAAFPGVLRLLLHRAMEGAPYLSNGAVAAAPVSSIATEATHGAAAGAQLLPPTPAAIADGAAPADGEYYEVCHALQAAEVQAESQWEVEELGRAWLRLQTSAAAATVSSTSALWYGECGRHGAGRSPLAKLPFSSAAAVSAAVDRHVRRGLETRIAALSHRAVAAALLRKVQLRSRPASTRVETAPPHLSSSDRAGGAYSVWPSMASRRGGGLAWVQDVLRQQARQAFTEPLLTWPQSAPSPARPVKSSLLSGPTGIYGPQSSPTMSAISAPMLCGDESLPPSPASAVLLEGFKGNKTAVFLTEVPGYAADAGTAVAGAAVCSSHVPERGALGTSEDTALTGSAGMTARQCSLSPQLPSVVDLSLPYDVDITLPRRDLCSTVLSPLPSLECMSVGYSEGDRLSSLGVHGAPALTLHRGYPAASAIPEAASLVSRSVSSASSLAMASTLHTATLSSHSVYPTLPARQRLLPPSTLHRAKLARTGSGGGAPHRQRSATTTVVGRKGIASDYTAITATRPPAAAAAMTASSRATSAGFGVRCRGVGGGGSRRSRATALQPLTYYSLLGNAGTTK
ncbi:conserved hypothetical protein [Leishmania braziliensis MHOM/BR/75/M2904]|uniref:Uncharacterized protein n=2 Tax=Leishmania braziliensis TaxID=5660 RepID=A4H526_LEIBR|nr:conserved hypothetical protein [Leishmania braziliensis MHOM/BR/75/M2904]CAJ2466910.1 unnamed protein product [Leishmania braziliensis]CAM41694.1 conserved hypothetical protein [Leishmania braziliensis MHOM/BR/75/M2904]SYZ63042.1 hypothetical_protein [Leishmania braziliensis MHOM/BR/75/M2904]